MSPHVTSIVNGFNRDSRSFDVLSNRTRTELRLLPASCSTKPASEHRTLQSGSDALENPQRLLVAFHAAFFRTIRCFLFFTLQFVWHQGSAVKLTGRRDAASSPRARSRRWTPGEAGGLRPASGPRPRPLGALGTDLPPESGFRLEVWPSCCLGPRCDAGAQRPLPALSRWP